MKKYVSSILAIGILLCVIVGGSGTVFAANALLAGAAKVDITPSASLLPLSNWEGFNFTGIYNNLYVRSVVLDNGETTAAIVSVELSNCPKNSGEIKESISDVTGIPTENILLEATHNHTSPNGMGRPKDPELVAKNAEYFDMATKATIESVVQAKASLRPAKYGYGEGTSYVNVNRDALFEDGFWMQGYNYTGYSDKTLAVIKFVDMEDHLICAIMNYAVHANLAFVEPDVDGKIKVASNLPGVASEYIENRFGNGAVVLWTSGAAGNQNPIMSNDIRIYAPDGVAEFANLPPGSGYVLMESLGREHGVDGIRTINSIPCDATEMPIAAVEQTLELPAQKGPEGFDNGYNHLLVDNMFKYYKGEENPRNKQLPDMLDDPEHPVPMAVQLMILGKIAIFAADAELYCEIGRDLKAASPFEKTIVMNHRGGAARGAGYVMDKSSRDKKTFNAFSRVKPGSADDIIVNGMLGMFAHLR